MKNIIEFPEMSVYNAPCWGGYLQLGFHMHYTDGNEARVGDVVTIDDKYKGHVVASMDRNEYLPGQEQWSYLKVGIMVDTDFGGLVHYTSEASENMCLVQRAKT